MVRVVEIAFLTLPKGQGASFFSGSSVFVLKNRVYHWRNTKFHQKNDLRFQLKFSAENSYFRVNIFYFDDHQLSMKISKEISYGVKYSQISLFTKECFLSFNLLLVKFWFTSFTVLFVFDWNRKDFLKR